MSPSIELIHCHLTIQGRFDLDERVGQFLNTEIFDSGGGAEHALQVLEKPAFAFEEVWDVIQDLDVVVEGVHGTARSLPWRPRQAPVRLAGGLLLSATYEISPCARVFWPHRNSEKP